MMAGLKGEREVVLAELLDDAGASFASYGTRAPDRADALTTIISNVTRRSGGGDRVIGVMRLTFTTAYAHAEAWRAIHALVASSLAATLAMALCLARMMRRLTVPMTELVRVVNAFQGGQLDASVGSPPSITPPPRHTPPS
jgi:anti-sigma-K factor RskA